MDRKKLDVLWLWISIVSFFLMSATFLLMPLDNMISSLKDSKIVLIAGIGFWSFLIIGIVSQVILAARRRSWYKTQRLSERRSNVRRIGLIVFGFNKLASAADILMIVSLIGMVVSMMFTKATGYICYVFLAMLSFAFCMHCILNGKIFYHITHHYKNNGKIERNTPNEHRKTEGEQ